MQTGRVTTSTTSPFKNLTPIYSISQIKKQKLDDYDLQIYEDFTTLFQMSISFNFSLLYLLMVAYYNSNILIVKSKNLPYPIWIRFVRVRHTGVYRVPHAVGRFHPTRTSL